MYGCLQDRIVSLEHLLACSTYSKASDINLRNRRIRPEAGISSHAVTKFIVWRASPRGCWISAATVIVPAGGYLLLDGTGAHFRRVTFSREISIELRFILHPGLFHFVVVCLLYHAVVSIVPVSNCCALGMISPCRAVYRSIRQRCIRTAVAVSHHYSGLVPHLQAWSNP